MDAQGFTPYPEELATTYVAKGYWPNQTLGDLLDQTVRRRGEAEALVDERRRVTYREYGENVDRLALALLDLGFKPGERLALQLPNWVEYCYFYFACAKIGVVAVLSLPQYRAREMEYILNLTESAGVVVPAEFHRHDYVGMIQELRPQVKSLRHVLVVGDTVPAGAVAVAELLERKLDEASAQRLAQVKPKPTDLAFLLWTGGTTAFPKGVPHTHNDYILVNRALGDRCGRGEDVPFLINIPISHNIGTGCGVVASVYYGSKLVMSTTAGATEFLQTVERERVGSVMVVPTQVVDLLNHPDLGNYDLSSLKTLACGGANFGPELVRGVREKLGSRPVNVFGMAEGVVSTTVADDPLDVVCYTVGVKCCEWDEIRVVDDDHKEVPVGVEGEVASRGPHVFRGYYKAPEVNQEAFDADGWLYSGDYGIIDENGRLRITGRKKDVILRGGENVAALEVEQPLQEHPKIQDVAVVAMPDPRLGERICVYIRPREGQAITLAEVQAHLEKEGVAKFKWPERVELIDEMPLTNIGKIAKNELRDLIKRKMQEEGAI